MKYSKLPKIAFSLILTLSLISGYSQKPLHQNLYDHALAAPVSLEQNIDSLAGYLKIPGQNDREIAETIFYWVAMNIQYVDPLYDPSDTTEMAKATLLSKKSGCEGTARLYYELCNAAGVECQLIFGIAMGYSQKRMKERQPNHGWNAVKSDGKWELVDCTWGGGGSTVIDGQETYVTELDLRYLFANPKSFVIDHFPEDSYWQLLGDNSISKRTFLSSDYQFKRNGKLVKISTK